MGDAPRAFIVYACAHCKRRIFADRSTAGTEGVCPICGKTGRVGGARGEPDSPPKRPLPATPISEDDAEEPYPPYPDDLPPGTSPMPVSPVSESDLPPELSPLARSEELTFDAVGLDPRDRRRAKRFRPRKGQLQVLGAAEGVAAIHDLSLAGLSFFTAGPDDPDQPEGYRPPDMVPTERVVIGLELPELAAPIELPGIVRRVDQQGRVNKFHIGVELGPLDDAARAILEKLRQTAGKPQSDDAW